MDPNSEFELKDGKKVTFIKYYFDKYGITFKDAKQPLIQSTSEYGREIFLIP